MGGIDVVIHRVALGGGAFHGVRRGALFRKMHDGIRSERTEELHEPGVILGDIDVGEGYIFPTDLLPRRQAFLNGSDRGEGFGA